MTYKDFEYHRPSNLEDACRLLDQLPNAQVLAGGTDLLVDIESGVRHARHVVSLKSIGELAHIEERDGAVAVGAACTTNSIGSSSLIQSYFPEITEMVADFASPQVRSRATVGGNICSAVACGDFPVILTALSAEVELVSGQGKRVVQLKDFFLANRETVRKRNEILIGILIPQKPPTAAACYVKFKRRASNSLAVASVGVFLDIQDHICKEARIVLGAVAPRPLLVNEASTLLQGKKIDDDVISKVATIAKQEAKPITDVRGTKEFRRELVYVLTKRALEQVVSKRSSV